MIWKSVRFLTPVLSSLIGVDLYRDNCTTAAERWEFIKRREICLSDNQRRETNISLSQRSDDEKKISKYYQSDRETKLSKISNIGTTQPFGASRDGMSYWNLIISSVAIRASSRLGDRKNIVVHFSGWQTLRLYCSMFFNYYSVACVGRGSAKHIRTQKWIFSWPFVQRYFLFSFYVFTVQHKK